jgi:predicted PurR-regulated permease PerM
MSFFSRDFQKIQTWVFFAFLLIALVVALYVASPLLVPLLWATILAAFFHPLYKRINKHIKSANASSFATLIIVVLLVIIPVSFMTASLVRELIGAVEHLRAPETVASITEFVERQKEHEFIGQYIQDFDVRTHIEDAIGMFGTALLNFVRDSFLSAFLFFLKTFVMLYALFFFLRDGEKLLGKLQRLLPFGDENERELYKSFAATSRATIRTSVLIAGAQGVFAGLWLAIIGFPSAIFFGTLIAFFAILPGLGAATVLVPIAIYLFFTAPLWQPLVIVAVLILITLFESFARPHLAGGEAIMHPVAFLVATIGGVWFFGASGIVFGPVIFAFVLALFDIYERTYRKDIDKEAPKIGVR